MHPSDFWIGNMQVLAIGWAEALATITIIYVSKVYFVEVCCMRKRSSKDDPLLETRGTSLIDHDNLPVVPHLVSSHANVQEADGAAAAIADDDGDAATAEEKRLVGEEGMQYHGGQDHDGTSGGRRIWLPAHERKAKTLFVAGVFVPPFGWYVGSLS